MKYYIYIYIYIKDIRGNIVNTLLVFELGGNYIILIMGMMPS